MGFFPDDWAGFSTTDIITDPNNNITHHLHQGGGFNLRGYRGYFIVENDSKDPSVITANNGASFSAELDFDGLFRIRPKKLKKYFHLDLYLFGDAGSVLYERTDDTQTISDVRFDAGLGAAFTIKRFAFLDEVKPLTIRFDMPLFLSHRPFAEQNFVQFRWVIGINRAF